MLNKVKIQNFKSIGEPGIELELKPLTFLVGPNGAGKSSTLEAIGVAAQRGTGGGILSLPNSEAAIHKRKSSQSVAQTIVDLYFSDRPNVLSGLGFRFRLVKEENGQVSQSEYRLQNDLPVSDSNTSATITKMLNELASQTYLVSATRGNVPYTSDTLGAINVNAVGSQGENILFVLATIFGRREHKDVADIVSKWADRFGIEELKAGYWGSNAVGADYVDHELKSILSLALSSAGSRQILTVITQLFWSPPRSLLIIEEPEISLHPQAQVDVLQMFAEAIKLHDKQILATTHSLIMMQAIGYAVQKGWLRSDQIAVYHVEKKKGLGTTVKKLPLNTKGYIKGWIPSFTKVDRELIGEVLKNLPAA